MKFILNGKYVSPSLSEGTPISHIPDFETPPLNPQYPFSKNLQHFLSGRKLLLQEIPYPIDLIHEHYSNGYISYHKGFTDSCHRCGNKKKHLFGKHDCAKCHLECMYCRHCISMGKVSQCTPLITWQGPPILFEKREQSLQWEGTLSPGQLQASEKIVAAAGLNKKLLIWAVAGAGKTEILFEGINRALSLGQTILIATPRSDVVHELTPRLKVAFPQTSIISLFGGSEDKGKQGQLVIATTHQLLRYENHFDFVVIDEVDAFPFSYDPMLHFATERAAKRTATTVLLTATPDKKLRQTPHLQIVKIPKRYHGHPLPVPKTVWCGNWRKLLEKKQISPPVLQWLERKNQQVFLFVPSVTILNKLVPILKSYFPQIEGVHAEDQHRREKVLKFRNNETQILVTTTILERGVTIPNVAVGVLGAENDIFTESALVQISGRAGRSAQYPTGEILFFHYGKTEAMLDAIDHIHEMNKLGGF